MSTLSQIVNPSIAVNVGDTEYKVRVLTLLQIAEIRETLVEGARSQYRKEVIELASALDSKDKSKYLLEALKDSPKFATEAEIGQLFAEDKGVKAVLRTALGVDDKTLVSLYKYTDELDRVYRVAMGIPEDAPAAPETVAELVPVPNAVSQSQAA